LTDDGHTPQQPAEREYAHEANMLFIHLDDHGRQYGNGYIKLFRAGAVRALPAGPWLHPHEPGKLQRVLSARARARMEGVRQR